MTVAEAWNAYISKPILGQADNTLRYFLQKVYDGEISGEVNFSATEHRVGTWVDGRPVYSKTYTLGTLATGSIAVPHGITDLDQIICPASGFVTLVGGIKRPIPVVALTSLSSNNSEVIAMKEFDGTNITGWVGGDYTGDNQIESGMFTIKYIKTV